MTDRAKAAQVIHRRRHLLASYGLTFDDYDTMSDAQGGVCAICGCGPSDMCPLVVDHDHCTKAARGLLCVTCNIRVGLVENSMRNYRDYAELVGVYLAAYGEGHPALAPGVGTGPLPRELKPSGRKDPDERGNCRLSVGQVLEIRRRVAAGESQRSLGREFGVANTTIGRVANGSAWRIVE
jgi:hypothetical protein